MRELSDTEPAAEAVLTRLARELPPERKLELALDMSQTILEAARSGVRLRHPEASEAELRRRFAELVLPPEILRGVLASLSCAGET